MNYKLIGMGVDDAFCNDEDVKLEEVVEIDGTDRGDENVEETLPDDIQLEFDMMHLEAVHNYK